MEKAGDTNSLLKQKGCTLCFACWVIRWQIVVFEVHKPVSMWIVLSVCLHVPVCVGVLFGANHLHYKCVSLQ